MSISTIGADTTTPTSPSPSIIAGIPLAEERGLGALTLPGYIREITQRWPDREALVMHEAHGTTRWSYADLWARSLEIARALIACRIGRGARVGVMMTNRPEWLSATFGAGLAGAIAVGVSTFSTPDELDHIFRTSGISVLLFERMVVKKDFDRVLRDLIPELDDAAPGEIVSLSYPFLRHVAVVAPAEGGGAIEDWSAFAARGRDVADALVDATAASTTPADPGLLFFSSGSTSKPKGIMNSHRGVCLQLWRWPRFYNLQPGDDVRCWSANGFFWSGNFSQAFGGTLSSGGSLVLQATFVPDEALALMAREQATMALAWPHQWKQLSDAVNWNDVDLSSLRFVDRRTPIGKHPTVSTDWEEPWAAYGNTETFTISSIFPSGTSQARINGSHGEPQPGNVFKIVDPLTGATVPMGERGEIAVKGPTLMLGYAGTPLADTLDENGFFRTGDGGYVDAGNRLYWEGRLSDIIKTGGANVSPIEVDDILRAIPGVKVCMTVGVPDELLGEMVVTCIVPKDGETVDEATVKAFAKERLASYKNPRKVLFFKESDIATTGTNKIKTADLRKLATERLAAKA